MTSNGHRQQRRKPRQQRDPRGGRNVKNEIGNRYGRLLVIARSESALRGRVQWECRCDCGQTITVSGDDLRRGHTVSCGCWKREQSATRLREHNPRREHGIGS